MKDANAPNMQNTITIYSNAVPIPSKNGRKAVKIDKTRLIGNNIIFNILRIHYLFFSSVYVLLTTIILVDNGSKQHINYQFLQFLTLVEASKPLILLNYLPLSLLWHETPSPPQRRRRKRQPRLSEAKPPLERRKIFLPAMRRHKKTRRLFLRERRESSREKQNSCIKRWNHPRKANFYHFINHDDAIKFSLISSAQKSKWNLIHKSIHYFYG